MAERHIHSFSVFCVIFPEPGEMLDDKNHGIIEHARKEYVSNTFHFSFILHARTHIYFCTIWISFIVVIIIVRINVFEQGMWGQKVRCQ